MNKNKKNKRGQAQILFVFMIGVVLFFLGLGLSPAVNDIINAARGQSHEGYVYNIDKSQWEINSSDPIDCSSATLSNQNKAVCTSEDMFKPLWVGLVFGLAGLVIGGIAIR